MIKRSRGVPSKPTTERPKKSFKKYKIREETFIYSDGDCVGFRYHNIKYNRTLKNSGDVVYKPKKPRQYGKALRKKKNRVVAGTNCGPPLLINTFDPLKKTIKVEDVDDQEFLDKIKRELDKFEGLDLRTEAEKNKELVDAVRRSLLAAPFEPTIDIEGPPFGSNKKFTVSVVPLGGGNPEGFQIIEYPWPKLGDPVKKFYLPPRTWELSGDDRLAGQRAKVISTICTGLSRSDRIKYDVDCFKRILEGDKSLAFEPFKDRWLLPGRHPEETYSRRL